MNCSPRRSPKTPIAVTSAVVKHPLASQNNLLSPASFIKVVCYKHMSHLDSPCPPPSNNPNGSKYLSLLFLDIPQVLSLCSSSCSHTACCVSGLSSPSCLYGGGGSYQRNLCRLHPPEVLGADLVAQLLQSAATNVVSHDPGPHMTPVTCW